MRNLISLSETTKNGTCIQFNNNFVVNEMPIGEMWRVTCPKSGRLYPSEMVDKTHR